MFSLLLRVNREKETINYYHLCGQMVTLDVGVPEESMMMKIRYDAADAIMCSLDRTKPPIFTKSDLAAKINLLMFSLFGSNQNLLESSLRIFRSFGKNLGRHLLSNSLLFC